MTKLKQSIEENGGFRHWFANVFWYHYKWGIIALVVVLTVVIYLTVDSMKIPKYDAKLAIASYSTVTDEQLQPLQDALSAASGDMNGDGKVNVLLRIANLGDSEYAEDYKEVFYTCLSDEDYTIFLLDADTSAVYSSAAMDYFQPLSDYDLPSDPDNPCRLSLQDNVLARQAGIEDLYVCILDHGLDSAGEDAQAHTEQTKRMLNALLDIG